MNRRFRDSCLKLKLIALIILLASPAPAANPGDEVIVIYNTRVPESKDLAEYYAQRRQVPKSQIFGFALSTGENISRSEFRDALQKPLANALEQDRLWRVRPVAIPGTNRETARVEWKVVESKIRYAVLCYGIPLRIEQDSSLKESVEAQIQQELRRNEAAVDTELALLPLIEQKPTLSGPWMNLLFASTNAAAFHPSNGVLMVTRLDGPTAAIARGLVDKAITADADGLWGRAYFDLRGITDPAYKLGDQWIRGASEIFRYLGFKTVVDENPGTFPPEFPMSQIAFYCGWYDAEVSGPFARTNVEFMPGAFAYHLHSYNASTLRFADRSWVGPLLAKGATISMGTVDEPYLSFTPDVMMFAARFTMGGFSFGEAAYAAQGVLSWQTTIIGDPLYRPFAKSPQSLHERFASSHEKLLEWSYLRMSNLTLFNAGAAKAAAYLEELPFTAQSAVLSEELGALYSALGKPSSAAELYDRALKLNPSPQQRIRLRLALAEKLIALERNQEAVEDLAKILNENPDYPARIEIYRMLAPLARKLGKNDVAANYEERIKELTPAPPK